MAMTVFFAMLAAIVAGLTRNASPNEPRAALLGFVALLVGVVDLTCGGSGWEAALVVVLPSFGILAAEAWTSHLRSMPEPSRKKFGWTMRFSLERAPKC